MTDRWREEAAVAALVINNDEEEEEEEKKRAHVRLENWRVVSQGDPLIVNI